MAPNSLLYNVAGATAAAIIAPIAAPAILGGIVGTAAAGPIAGGLFAGIHTGTLPVVGSLGALAIGGAASVLAAMVNARRQKARNIILERLRGERYVNKAALKGEKIKVVCERCWDIVWDEEKEQDESLSGIETAWDAWVAHRHR
ncbi:hypothetical protein CYLTODRAFT_425281 [Cylindrobasidium torrendii FP15055 ss-10]|uniref:Uncharacterized protein n=1 Tax=Cylindrobasidium torrendii FP15055 ss-10 TaxID=1314674 RepID=A0A0D7B2C2_9AGAR|nr:hypothetical protein CYLTODRAFT_425281 [Cylindrobasidium torrendii FP15055 ss-10]